MTEKNYGLIRSEEVLAALVQKVIDSGEVFGFDIETGYRGPNRNKGSLYPDWSECMVVGFSFTNSLEWARYVAINHDEGHNLDAVRVAEILWPLLNTGLGVAHNAKFERRHLARFFREHLPNNEDVQKTRGYFKVFSDSMIEAYLLSESQRFGLKPLVKEIFGHDQRELLSLFPEMKKKDEKALRFNILELTTDVINYACEDALWALALHRRNYPNVREMFLYGVEMEIMEILCEMEDFGIRYDWALMRSKAEELEKFIRFLDAEIQEDFSQWVGRPVLINLGSPQQLGNLLYNTLNLEATVFTDTGAPSTNEIALKSLSEQYPVVKRVLQWRELTTLLTRYLVKYEVEYAYAADGMAHPSHSQTVVGSGRFAVGDPAYQQSPGVYYYELRPAQMITAAHLEIHPPVYGKKCACPEWEEKYPPGSRFMISFRDCVIVPIDHYLLGFDFAQVELRVIAGESNETALLEAFNSGSDPHTTTASMMLNIPIDQVTKSDRAIGKTQNFAIAFGLSTGSLAKRLGVTYEKAEELVQKYFAAFSKLDAWIMERKATGRRQGHLISKFGRKVTIWELQSPNKKIRSKGERLCVNVPAQGGAADYMKVSMIRVTRAIKKAGLADRVHLSMNIHDALEFVVHKSVEPETVIRLLQPEITFPVPGWPKIEAEWHIGLRWGSLKELHVAEDGTVTIKGKKANPAPAPITEDGEVSDELDPDTELAAQALSAPESVETVGSPAQDRTLAVEISQMPHEWEFIKFRSLTDDGGTNRILLRTPEGEVTLPWKTSLEPAQRAEIAMVLPGAEVFWSEESMDATAVLGGISL